MHYSQYKTAALKHLQTCEYMIANLSYERSNKLKVLRNVYYLCGYSLEGLVNFWIFKLLNSEGLLAYPNDIFSYSNYPISLGSGKFLEWKGSNPATEYWFSQHNFQKNTEVFQHLADGDLISDVPIIGDITFEPFPKMIRVFRAWNVKVRYKEHPFSSIYPLMRNASFETTFETDIANFVKTTRLIYDTLEDIEFGR